MLNIVMAEGLQHIINTTLSLDPATKTLLTQHQGKVLQFVLINTNQHLYLQFLPEKILVLTQYDATPNTVIKGSLATFAHQVVPLFKQELPMVEGDTELAHDVQRLMKNFDTHWESYSSFFIGDAVTQKISQTLQTLRQTTRTIAQRTVEDTREYIQEEQPLIPGQEEVEDFYEEVAQLRQTLDRLEARWQRLQERNSKQ